MRVAKFNPEGNISIITAEMPAIEKNEVLLRVSACSLCGSDLRPWKNGWPVTPGHEIVGVVESKNHPLYKARCLAYIPVWCGKCEECLAGHTNLCRNANELIGWQRAGGYAEFLAVPEQCLLVVPQDIPTHLAPLLLDTIGTAAHGIRLAKKITSKGKVLVLGAGPIGLGGVLVLQDFGFTDISIFEPNPLRLEFAISLGAHAFSENKISPFYDLVLECSGRDSGRQMALEMVKPIGAVVQLGEADSWKIEETKAIRRKDFYYIRSFYFPLNEYEENIQILRRNKSKFKKLVDAQVSLDQLSELFVEFASGRRIKPQLHFQE